jgi:hypothetical protein
MKNMKKNYLLTLLFLFLIPFLSRSVFAQIIELTPDTLRRGAVKIFLDCQSCDMNYTREQINFANFVRDVKEAQVLNIQLPIRGWIYLKE